MFTIGEFASIGRVAVRMLRHYDEIGLLTPARVDPFTGYRFYGGRQFETLGRILEFKDLGFRLDEVTGIVDGSVDAETLVEMLTVKRAETESRMEIGAARLRRIDARLQHTEGDFTMITVELKSLPVQRIAQISAHAAGFGNENIGPVIGPMYASLAQRLASAGIEFGPTSLATYEALESGVKVNAAFPVSVEAVEGAEILDLPAVDMAATTVHHGSMATIVEA